jgi:16S rRNA (guanine527-N7)-methyltransferase
MFYLYRWKSEKGKRMIDFKNILKNETEKLGLVVTDEHLEKFIVYMELLKEYGKVMNLTALTEEKDILYKHFIDSLTAARYISRSRLKAIDIGTGAGFPLMPIKIVYDELEVTLVDSVGKKIDFLRALISKLDISGTQCIHARAEELARDKSHREKYDLAFTRAVAPMNVLVEYCVPFLKVKGRMLVMKGRDHEPADRALKELDSMIKKVHSFDIIYNGEKNSRKIIEIEKNAPTSEKYPRKAGIIKRNPL